MGISELLVLSQQLSTSCSHFLVTADVLTIDAPSSPDDDHSASGLRHVIDYHGVMGVEVDMLLLPSHKTYFHVAEGATLTITYRKAVGVSQWDGSTVRDDKPATVLELEGPQDASAHEAENSGCPLLIAGEQNPQRACKAVLRVPRLRAQTKGSKARDEGHKGRPSDRAAHLDAVTPAGAIKGLRTTYYKPACLPGAGQSCPAIPSGRGYVPNTHIVSFDTPSSLLGTGFGTNVAILFEGNFTPNVTGFYTFRARVDDALLIFVGTQSGPIFNHWMPTCWCDQTRWAAQYKVNLIAKTPYNIRIIYADMGGDAFLELGYDVSTTQSSTPFLNVTEIPAEQFSLFAGDYGPPADTSFGLSLSWYKPHCDPTKDCPAKPNGTTSVRSTYLSSLDNYDDLVGGVHARADVTFVFTGFFTPSTTGWYQFRTQVDDAVRVYIGDPAVLVIERWVATCWCDPVPQTSRTLRYLIAGVSVNLRVEYADFGGEAFLQLGYRVSSTEFGEDEIALVDSIPEDELTHLDTNPAASVSQPDTGAASDSPFAAGGDGSVKAAAAQGEKSHSSSLAVIVGATVGAVGAVALVVVGVYVAHRRNQGPRTINEAQPIAWDSPLRQSYSTARASSRVEFRVAA